VPSRGYGLLAFCGLGLLLGQYARDWVSTLDTSSLAFYGLTPNLRIKGLLSSLSAALCFMVVFLLPALRHPVRGELMRWIIRRRGV
jgi:hypothetical protein